MRCVRLGQWCIFAMVALLSIALHAADVDVAGSEPLPDASPADSTEINWVFSGIVTSESGDRYAYFFQMQRHERLFQVVSALFDADNKVLLSTDDSESLTTESGHYNWRVGRSFLRFNPINHSWIFGTKTLDKKGFNFKVDVLHQPTQEPVTQQLRAGVSVLTRQTGQLNGHIQFGETTADQFVTAKHTWFRQIWQTALQDKPHPISSVLCRFEDDSGFYSLKMPEPDALLGTSAQWFNAEGASMTMSQFVRVHETDDGAWHIRIASPLTHLVLSDAMKQRGMVAGFVLEKNKQGFCLLSEDSVG